LRRFELLQQQRQPAVFHGVRDVKGKQPGNPGARERCSTTANHPDQIANH
jgi:hypothetical protein